VGVLEKLDVNHNELKLDVDSKNV